MAKSLVRNRHAVTKLYGLKSQLQAVSLRIAVRSLLMQPRCHMFHAVACMQLPAAACWSGCVGEFIAANNLLGCLADAQIDAGHGRCYEGRNKGKSSPCTSGKHCTLIQLLHVISTRQTHRRSNCMHQEPFCLVLPAPCMLLPCSSATDILCLHHHMRPAAKTDAAALEAASSSQHHTKHTPINH